MSRTLEQPKNQAPAQRKNTKLVGERSEAAFLARAIDMGFGIAKPWGDSRRYDFILDNGECLHRVQVKCTEAIKADAYETRATYTTGKGRAVYTKKDTDFIASHVVPLDIWYIIPVEICTPQPMLRFYPHRKARIMRLEPYREAWNLILPKESNHVMELHAFADDTIYEQEEVKTETCGDSRPGCLPTEARPASVIEAELDHLVTEYRKIVDKLPVTQVAPNVAPWPIPPVKILASRKGKRILPDT